MLFHGDSLFRRKLVKGEAQQDEDQYKAVLSLLKTAQRKLGEEVGI